MVGKAKSILIYSGHCEIIGGDAKYLFDLVNHISPNDFSISIYTDKNRVFEERVQKELKVSSPIFYLNTSPQLFRKSSTHLQSSPLYRYLRFIYRTLTVQRIRHGLKNFYLFYKLFKNQSRSIDIFHFNNGGYPAKEAGLVAIIAARLARVPKIVMSFHNLPVHRRWFRFSDLFYDFLIARFCNKMIAASEALKNALIERRGFPAEKIVTIYCGLEDQVMLSEEEKRAYRSKLGLKEETPLLLISGNLDEDRKGHLPLFSALAEVKKIFPEVVLLVAGQGSNSRMNFFLEKIKELGIAENVKFLGYRTDIHELNSIVDIAIVPSLDLEATPYTIKEAARSAKPILTTSAGGCSEGVEDKVSGFILPPNDSKALAEAILKLLRDPSLRNSMGKAAREFFLKNFLLKTKIDQHEMIYINHS